MASGTNPFRNVSKENFVELLFNKRSFQGVCQTLNVKPCSRNYTSLSERLNELGLTK